MSFVLLSDKSQHESRFIFKTCQILRHCDHFSSSLTLLFDTLYSPSFENRPRTRNIVLLQETTSVCWNNVLWRMFFRLTSIAMAEPADNRAPGLPCRLEVWTSRGSSMFLPSQSSARHIPAPTSNGRVRLISLPPCTGMTGNGPQHSNETKGNKQNNNNYKIQSYIKHKYLTNFNILTCIIDK